MNGPAVDPRFSTALRSALAERVTTTPQRRGRRWHRPVAAGASVFALALVGGGVAVAAGWAQNPLGGWLPGASYDVALAPGIPSTQTGPVSISTDGAPEGTNGAQIAVTCIDAGTVVWPNGASSTCDGQPEGRPGWQLVDLPSGGGPLEFTATEGMRWGLELTWAQRSPTEWAVNARGETYGAQKDDGSLPDLRAAWATNGKEGYFRVSEFDAARGPALRSSGELGRWDKLPDVVVQISVYASDGTTVVGHFDVATKQGSGSG